MRGGKGYWCGVCYNIEILYMRGGKGYRLGCLLQYRDTVYEGWEGLPTGMFVTI